MKVPFYRQDWDVKQFKQMGFRDREECEYWKKSSCGVLCLKMAVEAFGGKKIKIKEYIDRGNLIGAYSHELGWNHVGLTILAREFNLRSDSYENLSLGDVKMYLLAGAWLIVSIPTAFERKNTWKDWLKFWHKTGGHLCLVRDCEETGGKMIGFRVNHTSIKSEWNWQNKFIDIKQFERGFTGRGLVIYK